MSSSARPCSPPSPARADPALIIVVSGPGGVGKGTLVRELVKRDPALWLSRSWTTRAPREGEPSDAYHFTDRAAFEAKAASGGFLEWAEFLGNGYGTPWPDAPGGRDVLLEIDVQGAEQVVRREPDALLIFLVPPSTGELRRRLQGRGDPPERVSERVEVAGRERAVAESLDAVIVVNDDLDRAVAEVHRCIETARAHRDLALGET